VTQGGLALLEEAVRSSYLQSFFMRHGLGRGPGGTSALSPTDIASRNVTWAIRGQGSSNELEIDAGGTAVDGPRQLVAGR
jgi:hypothetical protein